MLNGDEIRLLRLSSLYYYNHSERIRFVSLLVSTLSHIPLLVAFKLKSEIFNICEDNLNIISPLIYPMADSSFVKKWNVQVVSFDFWLVNVILIFKNL